MLLSTTALYAGVLGILAIALGAGSGFLRFKTGVSIGDGGDPKQLVAVRRHGNFIEWVPIALILLGVLELNGVGATPLHVMGGALVVGRVAHAVGLDAENMQKPLRGLGAGFTTLVVLVASVWAIATAVG